MKRFLLLLLVVPAAFGFLINPLSPRANVCIHYGDRDDLSESQQKEKEADVVCPGKSSALPGAQDYVLDISATEEVWMQQATAEEREIAVCTEQGLQSLQQLRLDDAYTHFARVLELDSKAYLWQMGIVLFYRDEYTASMELLQRNAKKYEAQFEMPASEERLWAHAAHIRQCRLLRQPRTLLFDDSDHQRALLKSESRRVLKLAHALFASLDPVHTALCRARLLALAHQPIQIDVKQTKLQAWWYLALYADCTGDSRAPAYLAHALTAAHQPHDLLHTFPVLHATLRDWFDVSDPIELVSPTQAFQETLVHDLQYVTHAQLADYLRTHHLKQQGDKQDYIRRIITHLMEQGEGGGDAV